MPMSDNLSERLPKNLKSCQVSLKYCEYLNGVEKIQSYYYSNLEILIVD